MKSIIQEASSVAKAIESAWLKAGKPQQFSVKIFQEAEKNFLGMTSKPAKIAILFNDVSEAQGAKTKQQAQPKSRPEQETRQERPIKKAPFKEKPLEHARPAKKQSDLQEGDAKKPSTLWSEELSSFAKKWLQETLASLGYGNITFETSARKQLLKIQFSEPLMLDDLKQKHLFRNIAFLLLQSVRREFKRPLRNARVVLLSEK
jgi:predicted RNA-binding protein Jag